jgi:simple sugar transport system substrate-binding protein
MKHIGFFRKVSVVAAVVITSAVITFFVGCDANRLDVLVVGVSQIDVSYSDIKESCEAWGEKAGAKLEMIAPALPTASEQQKILQERLDEDWDIICIEPLGVAEISPLLEYAKDRGTTIITMRGYDYPVADYNIEPFSSYQMGQRMMETFAKAMGSDGSYTTLLSSFEAQSILDTENAAVQLQKQSYGNMLLADRLAVTEGLAENAQAVIDKDKGYYGIKGVMFFTSTDGMGAAGQTTSQGEHMIAVGLGDIKVLQEPVESGDIDTLFYWDRVNQFLAGLEMGRLAAEGTTLDPSAASGISLKIEGYERVRHLSDNSWAGTDIRSTSNSQSS